jgi:SAM-dependent methyltransferase
MAAFYSQHQPDRSSSSGNSHPELAVARACLKRLPVVFPEEAYLALPISESKRIERRRRAERISDFLVRERDSLTLELGCCTGQMTTALQRATNGRLLAIERDADAVGQAQHRIGSNPRIDLYQDDLLSWSIPRQLAGAIDQIVSTYFFHEVYSSHGRAGYIEALRICRSLLRPGGRLLVIDGISPDAGSVVIRFRDTVMRAQLDQLCALYRHVQPFDVTDLGAGKYRMDTSTLAHFLNTLKFIVPDDLMSYEDTLASLTDERQQVARAFFLLDYYTRSQGAYQVELEQDFAFQDADSWRHSLSVCGMSVSELQTFNERHIEEELWRSGLEVTGLTGKARIHTLIVAERGTL